jgi:hypothetical protein
MKKYLSKITATSVSIVLMTVSHPLFAQVTTNTASAKTNSTLQLFLDIVAGASVILCTGAVILLGYRFWFEPNTKISDGKNIVIGGVLVGTAGAIAAYFRA